MERITKACKALNSNSWEIKTLTLSISILQVLITLNTALPLLLIQVSPRIKLLTLKANILKTTLLLQELITSTQNTPRRSKTTGWQKRTKKNLLWKPNGKKNQDNPRLPIDQVRVLFIILSLLSWLNSSRSWWRDLSSNWLREESEGLLDLGDSLTLWMFRGMVFCSLKSSRKLYLISSSICLM